MSFYKFPPIILASNSPRRKQLLSQCEIPFEVKSKNVEEVYPDHLKREEIPVFLSRIKAEAFLPEIRDEIVIAADTIVHLQGEILGKPDGLSGAMEMLKKISGKTHEVITGITFLHKNKFHSFYEVTEVTFTFLDIRQIEHYINLYKPLDKAGSYGIQEWIGLTGIEKINGCYYNVMGLPVNSVLRHLTDFLSSESL